jgi:hypothetical protein
MSVKATKLVAPVLFCQPHPSDSHPLAAYTHLWQKRGKREGHIVPD